MKRMASRNIAPTTFVVGVFLFNNNFKELLRAYYEKNNTLKIVVKFNLGGISYGKKM